MGFNMLTDPKKEEDYYLKKILDGNFMIGIFAILFIINITSWLIDFNHCIGT